MCTVSMVLSGVSWPSRPSHHERRRRSITARGRRPSLYFHLDHLQCLLFQLLANSVEILANESSWPVDRWRCYREIDAGSDFLRTSVREGEYHQALGQPQLTAVNEPTHKTQRSNLQRNQQFTRNSCEKLCRTVQSITCYYYCARFQ